MEKSIERNASHSQIQDKLSSAQAGDILNCYDHSSFEKAKAQLVAHKICGVSIQLLDQDGYAIRQVTSRKRQDGTSNQLSDRQINVIRALERVLEHCQKEGIQLIGYSDELVALPAATAADETACACALDIDASGVYRGADSLLPD